MHENISTEIHDFFKTLSKLEIKAKKFNLINDVYSKHQQALYLMVNS